MDKPKMMRLTEYVHGGGCAAKFDPSALRSVLSSLPAMEDDRLLEGYESGDDALVYQVTEEIVAIETVDFFPPMVDDPYLFGQIAAANALSDIYAMGATPSVAMSLLCYPTCSDLGPLREILRGGQDKVAEAGAVIAGGHTISDAVPKYGLCVTAFAPKGSVWSNKGARPGDVLVLTKKLGVGILMTASKACLLSADLFALVTGSMATLNKGARDAARDLSVHAATDVTGFGLTGHAMQMAVASGVSFVFDTSSLPLFPEVLSFARMGLNPEGLYRNVDYAASSVSFDPSVPQEMRDLCADPQTSGGLLLSLPEGDASLLVSRLEGAVVIGQVTEKGAHALTFR
jgi:selenide,water dikinase